MPPPRPPARRRGGGRRLPRVGLAVLAGIWLAAGLAGAAGYVDSYRRYRGFAPPVDPNGVARGRVLHQAFFSAALGREASYLVYLPPGYDRAAGTGRRFPVFYLLHGSPGYPEAFLNIAGLGVRLDVLLGERRVAPMLLVMPDGRIGGGTFSDSEWADGSRGRYGAFVLDVVADVDRRLRTEPVRTARVLGGYSEGGFGAVNVGLHHLASFAGLQAWSGYFVQGRSGTFAAAAPAVLSANSPLDYAASLGRGIARHPLRVFLYTGSLDPEARQMGPLVAELRAQGARAAAATYPGAHDWALWRAHAAQMLVMAALDFARAGERAAPASGAAARRALLAGLAVARETRRAEHLAALVYARQLAGCRAVVAGVERGAAGELARLSPHGRQVVQYHLVARCLTARSSAPAAVSVCLRLPDAIAIERRSALARRASITARCLSAPAGHG